MIDTGDADPQMWLRDISTAANQGVCCFGDVSVP
jgi:hypothetical protein